MRKLSTKKGFTLVEMIISLGIFTVVALVAVGALIKVMDANRKSITLKTAINNLNFALESMTREMRVGKTYHCFPGTNPVANVENLNTSSCDIPSGDWTIAFRSSKIVTINSKTCNVVYAYRYKGGTFKKAEATDCTSSINDNDFKQLISDDIVINTSIIKTDNDEQPKIFLYMKGVSGVKEKDKTEFAIQTTISQRLPK